MDLLNSRLSCSKMLFKICVGLAFGLDKAAKMMYHGDQQSGVGATWLHIFGLIGQDGVVVRVGGALRPVVVLS
jgi:hypothetical protein